MCYKGFLLSTALLSKNHLSHIFRDFEAGCYNAGYKVHAISLCNTFFYRKWPFLEIS